MVLKWSVRFCFRENIKRHRNPICIHEQSHSYDWVWAVPFAFPIFTQFVFLLDLEIEVCAIIIQIFFCSWDGQS